MEKSQTSLLTKYFLDNFPLDLIIGNTQPVNKKEELALYYLNALTEIISVFDRLIRYEKYFKDFYPNEDSGITQAEAIEYHLRAYIQDFYILQERVRKIIEHLIENLQYYDIQNVEDVKKALNYLSKQIHKTLKKITSDLRRRHVHDRSIGDFSLTRAKILKDLNIGNIPTPSDMKIDRVGAGKMYEDIIQTTKDKYIAQAIVNSTSLLGIKEWFSARFGYIFAELNGHASDIFKI